MNILKINDLRKLNELSILRIVLSRAPISRIEIAQEMGCDNTTVTRGIRNLLARQILASSGKLELEHGRPREQLILHSDGPLLIGISLEPKALHGQVTNLAGEIRFQEHLLFMSGCTRAEYLSALGNLTEKLFAFAGKRFAAFGVSTFGTSLVEDGSVLHNTANFHELSGLDLGDFFTRKCGRRPVFASMMLCRMCHEMELHPSLRFGVTMLVHLGSGIGMSLAVDGKSAFCRNQHNGELGHNICHPDGRECACGRKGCLEAYASTTAFLAQVKEVTGKPNLSMEEAFQLASQGKNKKINGIVDEIIKCLAFSLANQVNNLSPDNLVISGELLDLGDAFSDKLQTKIKELLFDYTAAPLNITFHTTQNGADPATGAALLARAKLFESPEEYEMMCPLIN